ncbi:hypothetical protein RISW2_07550 [Roseivivax isoporae LMG 25204]|uniref:DUF3445 domain-containing protein n=1 Tax=Roseivivax isoporae LMG 25204 TaxID=1449351 RepID=X7FCW7_9RHOB|nr:hypothetical protein RISW2_07550 [Roseivivax isoporae LMG 25204]
MLQQSMPYDATEERRLPGIQPLGDAPWLIADDAHAAQMAYRDSLLAERRDAVIAVRPEAADALDELLDTVLDALPAGHARRQEEVVRPDGVAVPLDRSDPIGTLCRLVQEDLCLMQKADGPEHVLTAAALCFPARWSLAEKIGRPMTTIHAPVERYDADVARRVQRLFDGLQVAMPIWRYNELWTSDPRLFQPERPKSWPKWTREAPLYLRSERQVLRRLPRTRAIVFSIHTYMLDRANVQGTRPPLPAEEPRTLSASAGPTA